MGSNDNIVSKDNKTEVKENAQTMGNDLKQAINIDIGTEEDQILAKPEEAVLDEKSENINDPDDQITSILYEIAADYEKKGDLHQAIDIYKMLMTDHPETRDAASSKEALIRIAGEYSKMGMNRMAISLYKEVLID